MDDIGSIDKMIKEKITGILKYSLAYAEGRLDKIEPEYKALKSALLPLTNYLKNARERIFDNPFEADLYIKDALILLKNLLDTK